MRWDLLWRVTKAAIMGLGAEVIIGTGDLRVAAAVGLGVGLGYLFGWLSCEERAQLGRTLGGDE